MGTQEGINPYLRNVLNALDRGKTDYEERGEWMKEERQRVEERTYLALSGPGDVVRRLKISALP